MYKVFNDNQQIIIASTGENLSSSEAVSICIKDFSRLKQIVDKQIFTNNSLDLILLSEEQDKLWKAFKKLFHFKVAAGGWTYNNQGELLMIKRHGLWDIPKGHLDPGESISECALREVNEETGVRQLHLGKALGQSYHIYPTKNHKVLKETHWFLMKTSYRGMLKPQEKEGISKAKWINEEKVLKKLSKGWKSLAYFYKEKVSINL